jgi:hypothetical protein
MSHSVARQSWIPAFAGMTPEKERMTPEKEEALRDHR